MSRIAASLAPFVLLALTVPAALAAPPAQFGSQGSGAGQFAEPRGIAVDQQSGDIYIADRNNFRIDRFASEGQFELAWGWGVIDGANELQVCGPAASPPTSSCRQGLHEGAEAGIFNLAEGIAVDNDPLSPSHGDVYVVDSGLSRVQKFGPSGEFLLMVGGQVNKTTLADLCTKADIEGSDQCGAGSPGTAPGSFETLTGRSVAVGPTGTVYVGDRDRVQLFSPAGSLESEIALPGAGFIENLAVDSAGDVYVKSSALEGTRKYGPGGAELGAPRDVGANAENNALTLGPAPAEQLFVNDFRAGTHHILSFDAAGTQIASFDPGGEAADAGKHGIAYSEALDALYVVNNGSVRIVTPPQPGPFVLPGSESATEIQPTTATLGATINPEGPEATECSFEYGPSNAYGQKTAPIALVGGPFEDQPVSAALAGLTPRSAYHYRVVCENAAAETTFGEDQIFETLPPVSILATSASQVTAASAILEAELNPHGLPSEYHFEYDTTPYLEGEAAHGDSTPPGGAGAGSTPVLRVAAIQGLAPNTTYHYRVVAENALGPVEGPDREFTTQGTTATLLADGRQWELVSPPNKHGSPLEPLTEEGGLIQAAADGSGLAYVALGPIDADPKGVRSPHDTQLLAARGPGGWSTQDIATPHEEISIIRPGFPSEYKFFSEDLGSSAVEPEGNTPLSSQTGERTPYRREVDGEFVPFVTASNVLPGVHFGGEETTVGGGTWGRGVEFRTATPDLGHVLLESPDLLTAGFKEGFESERPNLYELSGGALALVSTLPGGEPTSEAGFSVGVGWNDANMRGAISDDGDRVTFSAGGHLYLHSLALDQTLQLDQVQPGAESGPGAPVFQGASADAGKIFFTDASRLTGDSTALAEKPDLYMCEVSIGAGNDLECALSDLSVTPGQGEAPADVVGIVSAIGADGGQIYFAANGVLTETPNSAGQHAAPGECNSAGEATCNLYSYDTDSHQISLVAVLSSHDDPDWAGRTNLHFLGNLTARSSPNGRYFTFMSQRSLTGYDNRDVQSGRRDQEVYLFDSKTATLSCASCNPTGARPRGVFDPHVFPGLLVDHPTSWSDRSLAASIPGWTLQWLNLALYQSRYLSDSGRLFFNAADALVPSDTNEVMDVYEYEPPGVGDCSESTPTFSARSGGCVALVSSGTSPEESAFLDASESGNDVFFLTQSQLVRKDTDTALDVYDAAVGGGEPEEAPAPSCSGDACQQPASPPSHPTPGTSVLNGPGNVVACPKGKVHKGGKCVKKQSKKKHHKKQNAHKKHKKTKRATTNRGGAK